jgi:hypothetical protein
MPPTNTTFLTATELGSLPASTSQNVHDSGTTYEVFHKFTAPAGAVVVGVFARGDLSVYRPTVRVYVGPAASPIQILGIAALNKALQFPVTTITSLADLHLDDRNANRGSSRGRKALAQALRDYGAGRSILVDATGRVVAGNKVVAEATALHLPVTVVRTTGDRLVVVQRTDLNLTADPKARQLALADNRVGELSLEWDPQLLREFATEHISLEGLWTDEELEQLVGEGLGRGRTSDDAVIEPPATTIREGDLFGLGAHRLLCGDATVATDVTRLLDSVTPR